MTDDMEQKLRELRSNLPTARQNLSESDKHQLIQSIGGSRTVESIRKAMRNFPHDRIPWLFSSLDSQLVVDVMANDMESALARVKESRVRGQSGSSGGKPPQKKP